MMSRFSCLLLITCLASPAIGEGIAGFWKNAEHPVWIEILPEEGIGTAVRNDKFPERAGRQILKEVVPDKSRPNLWHAQVYIETMEKYLKAEISLPAENRMLLEGKVGFFSRSSEWLRVDAVPL